MKVGEEQYLTGMLLAKHIWEDTLYYTKANPNNCEK